MAGEDAHGVAEDRAARAAAFFDLDRTLMEGSSAFQFGRAAYRAGLMSRRQLVADAWANVRFRLRGSTDEGTLALRDRISASLAGTRVRDLERLGADVLARILPRIYPQVLAIAYEHQDAGRRVYIATAASNELADVLAHVLALDGGIGSQFSEVRDGVFTGAPADLFLYGAGQAQAPAGIPRASKRLAPAGAAIQVSQGAGCSRAPTHGGLGHPARDAVEGDGRGHGAKREHVPVVELLGRYGDCVSRSYRPVALP